MQNGFYIRLMALLTNLLMFVGTMSYADAQPVGKSNSFDFNQYHSFQNIHLPSDVNSINALFQDEQGLLWIGTKEGLYYYDGYGVLKLTVADGTVPYHVTSIVQTDEKHLCIGTLLGLYLYNMETERYDTVYKGMENIGSVMAMCLFNGRLWLGTSVGAVYYYDFARQTLHEVNAGKKVEYKIIHVLQPTNDKLYIGSYKGLSVYDPSSDALKDIPFPSTKNNSMITSLAWDKEENCIWVGTETKFFCYSKKDEAMKQIFMPVATPIESLTLDAQHNLLLGTINGLYVSDKAAPTQHLIHSSKNNQSLCNNLIKCCYADKDNNIWVGTDNGISLALHNTTYRQIHISELTDDDSGNQFTVIYKDSRGNSWFGGKNGLIQKTADGRVWWHHSGSTQHPLKHNYIRQVYEDSAHDIWITTDGGVAKYDQGKQRFSFYTITDQSGKRNARWAYDIVQDRDGWLWIATWGSGLFKVNKENLLKHYASPSVAAPYVAEVNLSAENSLSDYIYQLVIDRTNHVWGNLGSGMVCVDAKSNTFEWSACSVNRMVYDGNEHIWFCFGNRIYKYGLKTRKEELFYELPNESGIISSLVVAENLLGVSSSEGITYIDRTSDETRHFTLSQNDFEAGFYDASSNRILWGGNDMLVGFPLYKLHEKDEGTATPISILAIYNDNRKLFPGKDYEGVSIRTQKQISLPHNSRNIEIAIANLSYRAENNNVYYRIHKQSGWSKLAPGQNRIRLANLASGRYTLEIRNGSSPDSPYASRYDLSIRILPPWYASVLAYVVYALLFGALVFCVVRYVRLRISKEYEEVKRHLNLSDMKLELFVRNSRELKTSMNQVIIPVTKLIGEMDADGPKTQLDSVYKNALRLNTIIQNMLNIKMLDYDSEDNLCKSVIDICSLMQSVLQCFSSSYKEKGILVNVTSKPDQIWLEADTLKIENALLTLLSGIDKQTDVHEGILEIGLLKQGQNILVEFSDAGTGLLKDVCSLKPERTSFFKTLFSQNKALTNALTVEKYVVQHGGSVQFLSDREENEGVGNGVRIILPEGNIPLAEKREITQKTEDGERAMLLIVSDNIEDLTFLADSLRDDFNCATAYNSEMGLEIAQKHIPDLILLDISDSVEKAMDFCVSVKDNQITAAIPLVMLAAESATEAESESIRVGVDVFMAKPFNFNNLLLRLKQLLHARDSIEKRIRVEYFSQPMQIPIEAKDDDEAFLLQITTYIEEHLDDTELNVTTLCFDLQAEQKRLNNHVKKLTGCTTVEYIRRLRIRRAALLLSQTNMTVAEVMYRVGFSSPSYFSRCFAEMYMMTPSQYVIENRV